jgi:hypothetical protein
VGLIHGNVVRPLCFDVGEQRKQRHMFIFWCRLEFLATATCPLRANCGGSITLLIVKYTGATKRVFASRLSTYLSLPSTDTGHPVRESLRPWLSTYPQHSYPLRKDLNDALKRSARESLRCWLSTYPHAKPEL